MACNGFHLSEVVRQCVKMLEPVNEEKLVFEVDASLDPLFRMPPSCKTRNRIPYIRSYIRGLAQIKAGISTNAAGHYVSAAITHDRVNGLNGKIRAYVKNHAQCTYEDVKRDLGNAAALRLAALVKRNQLSKTEGKYELTPAGAVFTICEIDRSKRLCGFKPALV